MKSFTIAFMCLISSSLIGQTLTYDAYLKGHKVGEMIVVKEVSDNKTSVTSKTHIEAHMLFTIRVDIEAKATYMDGILIESDATSKQNGHLHASIQIDKTENGYTIDDDGDQTTISSAGLVGADMLYFEEPTKLSHTIALASGQYLDIEKGANGEYFFVHDGKKESHQYANGVLQQVIIDHKLYTVTMKLRQ